LPTLQNERVNNLSIDETLEYSKLFLKSAKFMTDHDTAGSDFKKTPGAMILIFVAMRIPLFTFLPEKKVDTSGISFG
jgi:hypothetical protein